jgi:uncharacterized protein (TIGR02246 family)
MICVLLTPAIKAASSLSAEDIKKIAELHTKYEKAWLRGDANAVRALFTVDCVLLPPHADKPRVGHKGLDEYWFPAAAPPTQVTKLIVTPKSIGGDGKIAYVWGTDEVEWITTVDGKSVTSSHSGIFLNVLEKQADGEWKLSHHMWDDPVQK